MYWCDLINYLQLYYNLLLNQQVEPIPLIQTNFLVNQW